MIVRYSLNLYVNTRAFPLFCLFLPCLSCSVRRLSCSVPRLSGVAAEIAFLAAFLPLITLTMGREPAAPRGKGCYFNKKEVVITTRSLRRVEVAATFGGQRNHHLRMQVAGNIKWSLFLLSLALASRSLARLQAGCRGSQLKRGK
jgi:hypothetical protein